MYSDLLGIYGLSLGLIGNFKDGETWLKKALKHAQQIEHIYSIGWIESHYGNFCSHKGEIKKSLEHMKNALECFKKSKANAYLGWQLSQIGWAYYLQGDMDKAFKYGQRGYKIHSDIKTPVLISWYFILFGCIYYSTDELENSRKNFEEAIKLSQKNSEKVSEGFAWIYLGRTLGKTRSLQKDNAERCIRRGIEILTNLKYKPLYSQGHLFLGELYFNSSQREKALKYLKRAEVNFKEMEMDYWLDKTQEVLSKV